MLNTQPLHDTFGVEIRNVDLHEALTNAALFAEIRDAFERHSLLLFRDQTLSRDAQMRFAENFGPLEDRQADERKPGEKMEIPVVSNKVGDGVSAENDLHTLQLKSNFLWHTDGTFLPTPALANIIMARVVPSSGGATEIASTRAAWADAPEALRSRFQDAILTHRYAHSRQQISAELAQTALITKWPDQRWRALWRNPVTGQDALYVASHACAIDDEETSGAQAEIREAIDFCTTPDRVYSHSWRPGDVLIWDERATLHRGTPWPYEEERTLSSICVSVTDADGLSAMRPTV